MGRVPVLIVDGETALFESAVICEYLEEVTLGRLHPQEPLERARHRSWIEFGSNLLSQIAGLYSANSEQPYEEVYAKLRSDLELLESHITTGGWFFGSSFHLIDAAFGPIFRYFDVLDELVSFNVDSGLPQIRQWRQNLRERPSVIAAVSPDYAERLAQFMLNRNSHLSTLIEANKKG